MDQQQVADIIEIQQVLAKYAVGMSQDDIEIVMEVFTDDGWYSAFGDRYLVADFPRLVEAAPKGLFMTGLPLIEIEGDTGTGTQPLCMVIQSDHSMRIGYYRDTYRRTDRGWRLATRQMTFMRKSGVHDHGRPHDPTRPAPSD